MEIAKSGEPVPETGTQSLVQIFEWSSRKRSFVNPNNP
jgi:hypothetical protein